MLASLDLGPERAQSWGMATRYDLREDDNGWTVYDLWTGKSVVIGRVAQTGLSPVDAAELATRLNLRGGQGLRDLLQ